jgi:5-methylcytosine-specific restriction enzyme subunit McrC
LVIAALRNGIGSFSLVGPSGRTNAIWRSGAIQWVGVIEVEELVIEILPKAERDRGDEDSVIAAPKWRRILLALLGIAGYMDVRALEDASLRLQDRTLLDVLFAKYLDSVDALIREGLVKRYRSVAMNRGSVKGRIDHAENIKKNAVHAERISTVAVEYDRINRANLILKAGVDASCRFAPSAYARKRSRNIGLYFSDWPTRVIRPADFRAIRFDRKTSGYRRAIDLARLILAKQNFDLSMGAEKVFSLLFDMNDLWQAAILARLRRECSRIHGVSVRGQRSKVFWRSASGAVKTIRPDILIEREDGPTIVVDTKWKVLTTSVPGDEDLKQIFSYNALWNAQEGYLLYPRVGDGLNEKGAYGVTINGLERQCGVAFANVDPRTWSGEQLLGYFGIGGAQNASP